jgi:hypothetical protein
MNDRTIIVCDGLDWNDGVTTRLVEMELGIPKREAAEYGGPGFDIARLGAVDMSGLVESRFVIDVFGSDPDSIVATVSQISASVRERASITIGLRGSAYTGTLVSVLGSCIEIPTDEPWRSMLARGERTRVEVTVKRDPYVYGPTETLADASAYDLPAVIDLSAQTGDHPAPLDILADFGAGEATQFFAGRYPDAGAATGDFVHLATALSWSGGAATTDAAGYPDGVGNTIWRADASAGVSAAIDVTDYEPGEYLVLCRGKSSNAAGVVYARQQYGAAVRLTGTTLALYPLGTVTLPTAAVRGAGAATLTVYLRGDDTYYACANAFYLVPASFGGLIGWQAATGHAHALRWSSDMLYADDVGALGEAFGGRRIVGKGGCLVAVAELATPAATTAADMTVTDEPRWEQFPAL